MTSGFVVEFFGSGAAGETFANPEDDVAEDDESTLGASKNPHLAILGFTNLKLLALGNLSRWAFLLTFAGVGLRTNLKDLFKQGAPRSS